MEMIMDYPVFADQGFEQAIKNTLGISGRITSEALLGINGVMITEASTNSLPVPWIGDASAFNMKFPDLIFSIADSENGRWESVLAHFSHIHSLHLYAPTKDLNLLGSFSALIELYVHDSKTPDWGFLSSLIRLLTLSLRRCHFADLTPVRELCSKQTEFDLIAGLRIPRELMNVSLTYCGIEDISPLHECGSIEDLNLSHNRISDISPLQGIKALHYLTLRYNHIKDISTLNDLYYLNARHNRISDISVLSKFNQMSRLYLGHNPIEDFSQLYPLSLVAHDIPGYERRHSV